MFELFIFLVLFFPFYIDGNALKDVFHPNCDVHEGKHGRKTPKSLMYEKADSSWLKGISHDEIVDYYLEGLKECQSHYRNNFIPSTDHVPPYIHPTDINPYGMKQCRGKALLSDVTGMTLWPFGPYQSCTTYSQCWFGVLSCGRFRNESFIRNTRQQMINDMTAIYKATKDSIDLQREDNFDLIVPKQSFWTIRSVMLHMRVVGNEIVSPDRRYYHIHIPATSENQNTAIYDDVIIGQYALTIPDPEHRSVLEIRMMELYPGLLYPWRQEAILRDKSMFFDESYYDNLAVMFLGGIETRCKPFTKCPVTSRLMDCDAASHLMHSPANIIVTDGSSRCPNLPLPSPLPICTSENTNPERLRNHGSNNFINPPGRWILSTSHQLQPNCDTDQKTFPSYNLMEMMTRKPEPLPKPPKRAPTSTVIVHNPAIHTRGRPGGRKGRRTRLLSSSLSSSDLSFYASGNPCLTSGEENLEELQSASWFYAPYQCRYHFYQRSELLQCFHEKNITHIHFQGDSISRELFAMVSRYLGIESVSPDEMKRMTNVLRQKNIQFFTPSNKNDPACHRKPAPSSCSSSGVLLSEGYMWDFELAVMQLSESPPLPNVMIMNHALAHRTTFPVNFQRAFNNSEGYYWKNQRKKDIPMPEYLIFQNGRDLQGRRESQFIGNHIRENSQFLYDQYVKGLGAMELDEYALSVGKFDVYHQASDGWHTVGTVRQMEAIVLMNMICNDWFVKK